LDKLDKQGHPVCLRISRAIPNNKAIPATALSVYDNLNLMAVGFSDGSILLYRGEAHYIWLIIGAYERLLYGSKESFCMYKLFCKINSK
jgi:hypothetical protein